MLDTTKIGDSIHAHRKRAGLTQRKLGELARIGISNISSYENGKIPCLYNAIAIADALRVSLDDLIGRVVMDCPTLTPPNEPLTLEQLRGMVEADRDSRCVVFFAKPGQEVWVVERDEIGKPDCVSGFVFMAEVGEFAIVHPFLGECGDIDEILNHCEEETARNYSCDVSVFPVADCYESYEAAEEALKGGWR